MTRILGLLAATCVSLACTASADTPSLSKAKAAFAKADAALNEAWSKAKAQLPESAFNQLRDDQRAWVDYRDYLSTSPMYTGVSGSEEDLRETAAYFDAASSLTGSRTDWLNGLLAPLPQNGSLTGYWIDSYGGHLELVENDGKLHFVIEVVRGPTVHLGGIAGIATWNQTIGWFSDKGREEGKDDETNLSFTHRNNQLEVIGANTMWYHGARAYFDGHYVRTGPLSDTQQLRVMKAAATGEIPEGE